jgi:hypothetical protein
MTIQFKKVVAKEFLFLILTISLTLISYFATYPYNNFKKYQVKEIDKKISLIEDSISKNSYNIKNKGKNQFYEIQKSKANLDYTFEDFWNRLYYLSSADSIKYKWENVWRKEIIESLKQSGIKNGEDFNKFIIENNFTKDDNTSKVQFERMIMQKEELMNESTLLKNSVINFNSQVDFAKYTFYILLILLFVIRHSYKGVIWSIKTLKDEKN